MRLGLTSSVMAALREGDRRGARSLPVRCSIRNDQGPKRPGSAICRVVRDDEAPDRRPCAFDVALAHEVERAAKRDERPLGQPVLLEQFPDRLEIEARPSRCDPRRAPRRRPAPPGRRARAPEIRAGASCRIRARPGWRSPTPARARIRCSPARRRISRSHRTSAVPLRPIRCRPHQNHGMLCSCRGISAGCPRCEAARAGIRSSWSRRCNSRSG